MIEHGARPPRKPHDAGLPEAPSIPYPGDVPHKPLKGGRLLDALDADAHPLTEALATWSSSRYFATFVGEHLPKIRKKLRTALEREAARDLLLELATAYHLSRDKRLSVRYEPTPSGASRGPDFAVRFTSRAEFMVEVTRLRGTADEPATLDTRRLGAVLALKLGQTVANTVNLLLIGVDDEPPTTADLDAMMRELRRDVETTDPEALLRKGFRHRGEYLRRLDRLSGVIAGRAPSFEPFDDELAANLWLNPRASSPLPNELRAALEKALGEPRPD